MVDAVQLSGADLEVPELPEFDALCLDDRMLTDSGTSAAATFGPVVCARSACAEQVGTKKESIELMSVLSVSPAAAAASAGPIRPTPLRPKRRPTAEPGMNGGRERPVRRPRTSVSEVEQALGLTSRIYAFGTDSILEEEAVEEPDMATVSRGVSDGSPLSRPRYNVMAREFIDHSPLPTVPAAALSRGQLRMSSDELGMSADDRTPSPSSPGSPFASIYVPGSPVSDRGSPHSPGSPGARRRRIRGASTNPLLAAGRKHVCNICSSRFLCKSKLDRHMLTHTGAKPFGCFCGKRFNQKSALKNHTRRHLKKGDAPVDNVMVSGLNGFSYESLLDQIIVDP